jgi:glycosyltransferase involved in cell wall biosynthesis
MKLLYDHEIFCIQQYGGASRYFYELITHLLNKSELDISVFAGYFTNEYGLEKYKDEFDRFSGRKYKEIPKTKMLMIKLNGLRFSAFLNKAKPDIYHQTYYGDFVKNFKGKRIVTVLDMTHEIFKGEFAAFDKTSEDKRKALEKADGVVCISESTKNDVMDLLNIPEDRIKVIYLANSLTTEVKEPPLVEGKYLLYVAKRKGYKNFKLIVDAFKRSKTLRDDFKLVCVGGGNFTSDERALMKESMINDPIYFSASDNSLANLYKYAFALVYPSKYEGFGIPPLEAMSYDCPVITTKVSSIPEVVGDAGIYIDPDDPQNLVEEIEKLLNDKNLRDSLVLRGKVQSQKFSWEKCALEHLDFYKTVLSK